MLFNTLSGRLILLTTLFVILAEVMILVPAVSRFRVEYLREHLERAQIASLALLATPDDMVEPDLEAELLDNAGVLNIVLQRDKRRELVLSSPFSGAVDESFDLREATEYTLLRDAVRCLLAPPGRIIRVIGPPVKGGGMVIEVTLPENPLRAELIAHGQGILALSLAVSSVAAVLLFLALRRFITRPIQRVAQNMSRFQEAPEDARRIIRPSSRMRELAEAEHALQDMQSRLNSALKQKERLAQLGGAVARISHDLRNMLTTAQLLVDRIDMSRDPKVKRVAPKLVASLDRAINLCERTLDFGRTEEPPPEPRRVLLRPFVDDLGEGELLAAQNAGIRFRNDVPEGLVCEADPDQLFRVLGNLIRNAREALEHVVTGGCICLSAVTVEGGVELIVADDGPGLPTSALENLFQPFRGSVRRGGSGLGLAIAAELVRGHGGRLELLDTSTEGTRFRIFLPGAHPLPGGGEKTVTSPRNSPLHTPESPDR
ncbi:HAMP domain-containing histidine kinase [Paroceanicella profunda]|uniref:Signal transduction histidine-protein kinase/phosphatase MprB n=1 Tax=Paroceanicella profunda TaxID=2579971 RepID=A0A5B8FG13_9RHOB|nr:HAMP domain-containing sensor histidine kinase [Paroceanicella profunda]QDL90567.1 HAMP domain-containing histidine kinase [Paroceanicella profunda]